MRPSLQSTEKESSQGGPGPCPRSYPAMQASMQATLIRQKLLSPQNPPRNPTGPAPAIDGRSCTMQVALQLPKVRKRWAATRSTHHSRHCISPFPSRYPSRPRNQTSRPGPICANGDQGREGGHRAGAGRAGLGQRAELCRMCCRRSMDSSAASPAVLRRARRALSGLAWRKVGQADPPRRAGSLQPPAGSLCRRTLAPALPPPWPHRSGARRSWRQTAARPRCGCSSACGAAQKSSALTAVSGQWIGIELPSTEELGPDCGQWAMDRNRAARHRGARP